MEERKRKRKGAALQRHHNPKTRMVRRTTNKKVRTRLLAESIFLLSFALRPRAPPPACCAGYPQASYAAGCG